MNILLLLYYIILLLVVVVVLYTDLVCSWCWPQGRRSRSSTRCHNNAAASALKTCRSRPAWRHRRYDVPSHQQVRAVCRIRPLRHTCHQRPVNSLQKHWRSLFTRPNTAASVNNLTNKWKDKKRHCSFVFISTDSTFSECSVVIFSVASLCVSVWVLTFEALT